MNDPLICRRYNMWLAVTDFTMISNSFKGYDQQNVSYGHNYFDLLLRWSQIRISVSDGKLKKYIELKLLNN